MINDKFDPEVMRKLDRVLCALEGCNDIGQKLSSAGCVGPRRLSEQNPLARYLGRKLKKRCQVKAMPDWWCWVWSDMPDTRVLAAAPLPPDVKDWADAFEGGAHEYLALTTPNVRSPWGDANAVYPLVEGVWWVRADADSGIIAKHPDVLRVFSLDCLKMSKGMGGWYAWGEGRWMIPALELPEKQVELILQQADVHRDALIQPSKSLATIANAYPLGRKYLKAIDSAFLFSADSIVSFHSAGGGTVRVVTAEAGEFEVTIASLHAVMQGGDWPIPVGKLEVLGGQEG